MRMYTKLDCMHGNVRKSESMLTFFSLLQGHLRVTRLLHTSAHAPGWQVREHECPQGSWSFQHTYICTDEQYKYVHIYVVGGKTYMVGSHKTATYIVLCTYIQQK